MEVGTSDKPGRVSQRCEALPGGRGQVDKAPCAGVAVAGRVVLDNRGEDEDFDGPLEQPAWVGRLIHGRWLPVGVFGSKHAS